MSTSLFVCWLSQLLHCWAGLRSLLKPFSLLSKSVFQALKNQSIFPMKLSLALGFYCSQREMGSRNPGLDHL